MSTTEGEDQRPVAPDLVLMDVMLPHLSGDEVVRIMRETPGLDRVPIVLMSAIPPARKAEAAKAGPSSRNPSASRRSSIPSSA
jgi:CheY-like chemotaxis protein